MSMADVVDFVDDARPPPKKRRRVVISCFECHRRKQKCDRGLPCGNCVTRNKESSCAYEAGAPTSRSLEDHGRLLKKQPSQPTTSESISSSSKASPLDEEASLASMAAALGYASSGPSTLDLLQSIETADQDNDSNSENSPKSGTTLFQQPSRPGRESSPVRQKYKGLIRQLPSKMHIEQLTQMYYRDIDQQYNFVDRDIFDAQLQRWNTLPLTALSAPDELDAEMRFFPALLFQMLACALLLLSPGRPDPMFDALKYAGGMTFEDLATDYSESGMAIMSLFGKSDLSETTVQAQFTRALFLKYTAHVSECWHGVAAAIRDAQELGFHRDNLDPKPKESSIESILENQWLIQRRRKMYMYLVTWDTNMAVFLGRPGSIDWHRGLPSLPIDAPVPPSRTKTPVMPRNEATDPPTLVTRAIWLFKLARNLRLILDLEFDGSHPRDFTRVDETHRRLQTLEKEKPAVFRLQNPDKRWDEHTDVKEWIHMTRLHFEQLHYFALMALHRPYIFSHPPSREAALTASVNMLALQQRMFDGLPLAAWRGFHLFFGSFDAIVVVASIFILFPHQHHEMRDSAVERFHWTMERFAAMRERNAVARAAQGVLAAIHSRFIKAVGHRKSASPSTAISAPQSSSLFTPQEPSNTTPESSLESSLAAAVPGNCASSSTTTTSMAQPAGVQPSPLPENWGVPAPWTFPPDELGLSTLAPLYPTYELLFNDLVARAGPLDPQLAAGGGDDGDGTGDGMMPFLFDGDFGGDKTFWQWMNSQT